MRQLFLICCGTVLILSSCINLRVKKVLARHQITQQQEIENLESDLKYKEQESITWNHAWKLLQESNIDYIQSKQRLEKSQKATKKQWKSLIPGVSAYANLGDSINDLSRLNISDINFRVISLLRIPNPFQFYAQLYGAALEKQSALWLFEIDRRQFYVNLYQAFLEAKQLADEEIQMLENKTRIFSLPTDQYTESFKNLEQSLHSLKQKKMRHRVRVNQLLNTPGKNWHLAGKIPAIYYGSRVHRLQLGDSYGKLGLNLAMIQQELAYLAARKIKLDRWPTFTVNLSSPTLYSSDQNSPEIRAENLYLFSGLYKSYRFDDILEIEKIEDVALRLKINHAQLRLRAEKEISQLNHIKQQYQHLITQRERLEKQKNSIHQAQSSSTHLFLKDMQQLAKIHEELRTNESQRQYLDLQIVIWDDNHWK